MSVRGHAERTTKKNTRAAISKRMFFVGGLNCKPDSATTSGPCDTCRLGPGGRAGGCNELRRTFNASVKNGLLWNRLDSNLTQSSDLTQKAVARWRNYIDLSSKRMSRCTEVEKIKYIIYDTSCDGNWRFGTWILMLVYTLFKKKTTQIDPGFRPNKPTSIDIDFHRQFCILFFFKREKIFQMCLCFEYIFFILSNTLFHFQVIHGGNSEVRIRFLFNRLKWFPP